MKKTIVVYGSSTGICEDIAGTIGEKLGAEVINAADFSEETVKEHDNLILGTSSQGEGEVQDDWYEPLKMLESADLSGKTVAIFGCGDSANHPETFCGGMHEIYDAVQGANILPGVSTEGYTFDDSQAVADGKFIGLALDDENEEDMTEERIDAWLESIKGAL